MRTTRDDGRGNRRVRRYLLVPLLVGLGLVGVVMVSASALAPQAVEYHRERLSTPAWFGAYPDIATGADGLVAAIWTEGPDAVDKHSGRLMLAWANNASSGWKVVRVDRPEDGMVYDSAVAVSGSTVHVLWSQPKNTLRYAVCTPPDYQCTTTRDRVAVVAEEALQVDIVVDGVGAPHVVWVEVVMENNVKKRKIFYTRKSGIWIPKHHVGYSVDSEGPAIAYANNFIHLVWTEWKNIQHSDSQINYCRRSMVDSDWSLCVAPLSSWFTGDYLARNASIAADGAGNVYAAWDIVSEDDTGYQRQYAIAYGHATDNGSSWRTTRTYPRGNQYGNDYSGAQIFKSGGPDPQISGEWIEYLQFLRPHISLVVSGTDTVPVMAWHAQFDPGSGEEGAAEAAQLTPHKVYWTYAARPGSTPLGPGGDGYMYWATEYYTLSLDLCGDVNLARDSATGSMAMVGDLNEILAGQSPGNHLHGVYHEETGGEFWAVFYNNSVPGDCNDVILPAVFLNGSGGEE